MSTTAKVYICGVPEASCSGALKSVSHGLGLHKKVHVSPEQAFNCNARYLIKQGYTRIGRKEFFPPDGGPIIILTRSSKFGMPLRVGKEHTRHMPNRRTGGGIISK